MIRDDAGVPVEWTLLKLGETPYCQDGKDGVIFLTPDGMQHILEYQAKKGELIPIDSEHYLYQLANEKGVDESDALRMIPDGVAAMGFGKLNGDGDKLRIRVKWTPSAYKLMQEKIYKYFSPVIRGLENGPLRVTSVAMTNTPAINHLDALAARSENNQKKEPDMGKLEKALQRLTGRDSIALGCETTEAEKDKIACEVDEKAGLIEQVKTLLGLAGDAGLEEIIAALKAELDKAKTADDKQNKLEELELSAEKQAHADLVAKGRAEGKIDDADMEYVNSLNSKALSAHLAHTGVKVPVGRIPAAKRTETADAAALTAEDRAAIRRYGLNESEFLKIKNERVK